MAAARKGKPILLNVNSFGGRIPLRNMAAYTASKFALAGFTDAIRPEFADLGIHVAQVHPGTLKASLLTLHNRAHVKINTARQNPNFGSSRQTPTTFTILH